MQTWEIKFKVNSTETIQTVKASSDFAAKKIIEAQFAGSKVIFLGSRRIY